MLLFDTHTDIQNQASSLVGTVSKVVWLVLATLVPALITAVVKAVENHSHEHRSADLSDRISKLAKCIAELPELPADTSPVLTPRAALTAELNLAVTELAALQCKSRHSFRSVSTNATSKLRGALLLYRPKGGLAVTLHTAFYVYAAVFFFVILAVVLPSDQKSAPFISTASPSAFFSDFLAVMFLVGIFSIPALVIRHFAAKIHRKQTAILSPPVIAAPIIAEPAQPAA